MVDIEINSSILAVIVTEESQNRVIQGGTPIFITKNEKEQQDLGLTLSRILKAMVHDLNNGVLILVRH